MSGCARWGGVFHTDFTKHAYAIIMYVALEARKECASAKERKTSLTLPTMALLAPASLAPLHPQSHMQQVH